DVVYQTQVCIASTRPLHGAEESAAGVLERQIEVGSDLGIAGDLGDQGGTDLPRIEVEEAQRVQTLYLGERAQQVDDVGSSRGILEIPPVGGQVLGHQHDLGDAASHQRLGLLANLHRAP